jgi:hypothetical protein
VKVFPLRTSRTQCGGVWLPLQLEVVPPAVERTWNWNRFPPVRTIATLGASAASDPRIMMPPLEPEAVFWTLVMRARISPSPDSDW